MNVSANIIIGSASHTPRLRSGHFEQQRIFLLVFGNARFSDSSLLIFLIAPFRGVVESLQRRV